MIYQFPEFVSQYKDRYPHSVKSEVKKHFNHLKVENIWKTQFSQQKSGLTNYTIYFYSKNNISSSFIKGEHGGSVVECRTPEREVGGS